MDVNALSQMQALVLSEASDLFDEIHAIADFQGIALMQYDLLTIAELDRIETLILLLQDVFYSDNNEDEFLEIEVGTTYYVYYDNEELVFQFTPSITGIYTFSAFSESNQTDTYVILLDSTFSEIDSDVLSVTSIFIEDQTYYFVVESSTEYVSLVVTLGGYVN